MSTINVTPAADVYVDQNNPTSNFNGVGYLVVGIDNDTLRPGSGGVCHAWLRFSIAGIPVGQSITSAPLNLYQFYLGGDGAYDTYSLVVQRSTDITWSASTITWNTQPAVLAPIVGSIFLDPGAPQLGHIIIDIKDAVQAAYTAGATSVSIMITTDQAIAGSPTEGSELSEFSFGNGFSNLDITYSPAITARQRGLSFF